MCNNWDQTFRDRKITCPKIKHGDWLCWYHRGTNNKWTYDLMNHLMVDLETIVGLNFMRCIINLNVYELYPRDEKLFDNFINEC